MSARSRRWVVVRARPRWLADGCRDGLGSRGDGGTRRWPSGDEGSGTVLLLGLVCVVMLLMGFLGVLASAQSARARAQAASDLAALAAATRLLPLGGGDACGMAGQTAVRNGGRLVACVDEGGGVVRVRVEVATRIGSASAEARAGPVSARSDG
ncbi:Rv3654c family TadE-like protein [Cellulomonas sp. McL0617]|uniref:Rv3654c family TadE-like protein n=1 Tax=Cellulomonas sp. McL0617 TaxID=3415675 RepID=UPI003CEABD31